MHEFHVSSKCLHYICLHTSAGIQQGCYENLSVTVIIFFFQLIILSLNQNTQCRFVNELILDFFEVVTDIRIIYTTYDYFFSVSDRRHQYRE